MVTKTDQQVEDHVIGQRVGDSYRISWWIGAGGMGSVYGAESTAFGGRRIAVKILTTKDHQAVERFSREAYAAGVISDPFSIVGLVDTGVLQTGEHYIALEYCDGGSLQDVIDQRGGQLLSFDDILAYMSPVCSALVKAHRASVVHRDIKPANILFVKDGKVSRAKLTDFGIAKLRERTGLVMTGPSAIMGTPGYMSPEQCVHTAEVDSRGDIYAIGCVLYELVTGRLPYLGTTPQLIQQAVTNAPIIPPSKLRRGVPEIWDQTIMRCLAYRREDRISTALEVIRALAAGVENGEAKMAFFAPNLIEDVALAPTAKTISDSVGPAVTLWSQAAHSSIRRSKRRTAMMFVVGAALGIVIGGSAMALRQRDGSNALSEERTIAAVENVPGVSQPSVENKAHGPTVAGSVARSMASATTPPSSVTTAPPSSPTDASRTNSPSPATSEPAPSAHPAPEHASPVPYAQPSGPPQPPAVEQPKPPARPTPARPTPAPPAVAPPQPRPSTIHAPVDTAAVGAARSEAWLSVRVKGFAEISVDGDPPGSAPRRKHVRVGEHHIVMTGYPDGAEQQRREFDVNVLPTREETVIVKSW